MNRDIESEIIRRGIPQSWQNIYRRARKGNRPCAVKAQCGECQGYDRQAIRCCTDGGCPLFAVRPFQKKAGSATETVIDLDSDMDSGGQEQDSSFIKSKILDHLKYKGESGRGYIVFSTGIDESLWNEAIKSLLAEGEIERIGEKRNTRYRLKE